MKLTYTKIIQTRFIQMNMKHFFYVVKSFKDKIWLFMIYRIFFNKIKSKIIFFNYIFSQNVCLSFLIVGFD